MIATPSRGRADDRFVSASNRLYKLMSLSVFIAMALSACEGAHRALPYSRLPEESVPLSDSAYPANNWGGAIGKALPNFSLTGVLSANTPTETGVVSMADYYDPEGDRFDLLHITIVTLWCPHCANQSKDLGANAEWLREHHVANLEIVIDGSTVGTVPTVKDASAWAVRHGLSFPVLLDGKEAITSKIWDIPSIPMHILVDTHNMKILDIRMGEISNLRSYVLRF